MNKKRHSLSLISLAAIFILGPGSIAEALTVEEMESKIIKTCQDATKDERSIVEALNDAGEATGKATSNLLEAFESCRSKLRSEFFAEANKDKPDIVGAFGLELGAHFGAKKVDKSWTYQNLPIVSITPPIKAGGMLDSYAIALTPKTNRIAAIFAFSKNMANEETKCEKDAKRLSEKIGEKYGLFANSSPLWTQGGIFTLEKNNRKIIIGCIGSALTSPAKIEVKYIDDKLIEAFEAEYFEIFNKDLDLSAF